MKRHDKPAVDWRRRLTEQGIDEARVGDAEAAGRGMAAAADDLMFDPRQAIAPGEFVALLAASAKAGT